MNHKIAKKQTNKRDEIYVTLPLVLFWISFSFSGFLRRRKIHQSSSFRAKPGKYNNKNKNWTKNHSPRAVLMTRHVTHISRVASLVTKSYGTANTALNVLRNKRLRMAGCAKIGTRSTNQRRGRGRFDLPTTPDFVVLFLALAPILGPNKLLQWFLRKNFITAVG